MPLSKLLVLCVVHLSSLQSNGYGQERLRPLINVRYPVDDQFAYMSAVSRTTKGKTPRNKKLSLTHANQAVRLPSKGRRISHFFRKTWLTQ